MLLSIAVGIALLVGLGALAGAEREARKYRGAVRLHYDSGMECGEAWGLSVWKLPNHPEFSYLVSTFACGEMENCHFKTLDDALEFAEIDRKSFGAEDWWG